jgi:hypothetical protein
MNKLLPILLVVVLSGCASQPKNHSVEYTSNAKEVLGVCEDLNCKLADELCGVKNDKGFRKVDEDECRMKLARHNYSNEPKIAKPIYYNSDPCLEIDCSVTSKLASEICYNWSNSNKTRLNDTECKMMIKRYQKRVMNGESHDEAVYFSVKFVKPGEITTPSAFSKMLDGMRHDRIREITKKREAANRDLINRCLATLKKGVYKNKPESWLRDKCNPYSR